MNQPQQKERGITMKKMLVLFAVVAVVTVSGFAAVAADAPGMVTYESKMGNVSFDHDKHKGLGECSVCHHTGDQVGCKTCHGVDAKAPNAKKAYHKQCKDCHKEQGGPTKCKGCHVK
jgi:hypothetical protein